MTKGRKSIPNEVKILRGTDQPCRMKEEIELSKMSAIPKSGLKGTSKKIFELVASELINKNLLEHVGIDLLIAYSREMALYHEMTKELEKGKGSYTIEEATKTGTKTVINPKRKIAESALANAKSIASEYGFTPASRSRISAIAGEIKNSDDFAEFEEINDHE